jgi:hypothetical protein
LEISKSQRPEEQGRRSLWSLPPTSLARRSPAHTPTSHKSPLHGQSRSQPCRTKREGPGLRCSLIPNVSQRCGTPPTVSPNLQEAPRPRTKIHQRYDIYPGSRVIALTTSSILPGLYDTHMQQRLSHVRSYEAPSVPRNPDSIRPRTLQGLPCAHPGVKCSAESRCPKYGPYFP